MYSRFIENHKKSASWTWSGVFSYSSQDAPNEAADLVQLTIQMKITELWFLPKKVVHLNKQFM